MKLRIKLNKRPVITIARRGIRERCLVYIACANKTIRYRYGQSPVVYIGTTQNGISRIAESAAHTAKKIFDRHGIRQLGFYVVSCTSRKKLASWRVLERALLLTFRSDYGEVPYLNTQGKNIKSHGEQKFFSGNRLRTIIQFFTNKKITKS